MASRALARAGWRAAGAGRQVGRAPCSRSLAVQVAPPQDGEGELISARNNEPTHLKFILKLLGWNSAESLSIRQANALYDRCVEKGGENSFLEEFGLEPRFKTVHDSISLHVWMAHRRLAVEEDNAKEQVQQELFDTFWQDTSHRIRDEGVFEITVNKHLRQCQEMTFDMLGELDAAVASEDNSLVLESALWRSVFQADDAVPDAEVERLADYVRRECASLEDIDGDSFAWGEFEWGTARRST